MRAQLLCIGPQFGGQHGGADRQRFSIEIDVDLRQARLSVEHVLYRRADVARSLRFPGDLAQGNTQRNGQRHEAQHDRDHLQQGVAFRQAAAEPVSPRHHRRRQCDSHQIGHKQQQRPGKNRPVERRKAEADHRQRRHQGGGDGDAHHRARAPPDHGIATGERGKQRHQQVKQIGPGTRGDFRRHRLQG